MKFRVNKPVEIDVQAIRIEVPVRYEEEDMPRDFPFRRGDIWEITVDIETGKIRDWPAGVAHHLEMKVCDGGSYWLLDESGQVVGAIEQDYVPGVIPGDWGDYIVMDIREDGTIANWRPVNSALQEFFPE